MPDAATSAPIHRSVRAILREFLEKVITDEDEIHLAEIITYARARFAEDEEFHQAVLDDALGLLVADALRELMRHRRGFTTRGGAVSGAALDVRAKELAARIFESVGDGRRKSLLAMTRADLDVAIGRREMFIAGLSRFNAFARDLRKGLRNDRQTVGERYSDAQFEEIWRSHFDRPSGDQLKILTSPAAALPSP